MMAKNTNKRQSSRFFFILPFIGLLIVAFASCGSDSSGSGADVAGETSVEWPDLGGVDGENDAEADAPTPDLSADVIEPDYPLRELVTVPLFGDMPIENRVISPTFDLMHSYSWFGTDGSWGYDVVLHVLTLPTTPSDLPVLMVPEAGNPDDVVVMGQVINNGMAQTSSVWIGRSVLDGDDDCGDVDVDVSILGYSLDVHQPYFAADLDCDEASRQEIDGVTWYQFSGTTLDLLDWGYIYIEDEGGPDLYITGPTLVGLDEGSQVNATRAPNMRPATDQERMLLVEATRERARRLSPLPHPHQVLSNTALPILPKLERAP